jgi:hypothetical protein
MGFYLIYSRHSLSGSNHNRDMANSSSKLSMAVQLANMLAGNKLNMEISKIR